MATPSSAPSTTTISFFGAFLPPPPPSFPIARVAQHTITASSHQSTSLVFHGSLLHINHLKYSLHLLKVLLENQSSLCDPCLTNLRSVLRLLEEFQSTPIETSTINLLEQSTVLQTVHQSFNAVFSFLIPRLADIHFPEQDKVKAHLIDMLTTENQAHQQELRSLPAEQPVSSYALYQFDSSMGFDYAAKSAKQTKDHLDGLTTLTDNLRQKLFDLRTGLKTASDIVGNIQLVSIELSKIHSSFPGHQKAPEQIASLAAPAQDPQETDTQPSLHQESGFADAFKKRVSEQHLTLIQITKTLEESLQCLHSFMIWNVRQIYALSLMYEVRLSSSLISRIGTLEARLLHSSSFPSQSTPLPMSTILHAPTYKREAPDSLRPPTHSEPPSGMNPGHLGSPYFSQAMLRPPHPMMPSGLPVAMPPPLYAAPANTSYYVGKNDEAQRQSNSERPVDIQPLPCTAMNPVHFGLPYPSPTMLRPPYPIMSPGFPVAMQFHPYAVMHPAAHFRSLYPSYPMGYPVAMPSPLYAAPANTTLHSVGNANDEDQQQSNLDSAHLPIQHKRPRRSTRQEDRH